MSPLDGYPISAWKHVDAYVGGRGNNNNQRKDTGCGLFFFSLFFYFYFWIKFRSPLYCFDFFSLALSSLFLCLPSFSSSLFFLSPSSLLPFLPSLSSFHLFFASFPFFIFYWPFGLNPGLQPCCVLGSLSAAEFPPDRLALLHSGHALA